MSHGVCMETTRTATTPAIPRRLLAFALGAGLAVAGCDESEPRTGEGDPEDADIAAALEDYCVETGDCADGKSDGVTVVLGTIALWKGLTWLVRNTVSFEWIQENWCVSPDRFSHFVDYASFDGGVPSFTSVQDFEIRRPDLEPEQVLEAFQDDWMIWWENGGTNPDTTGPHGPGVWHQEIAPLGLPQVNIVMDVPEIDVIDHPPLRNASLDVTGGYAEKWDAGLEIEMSPGNAFDGTMYVLARKTETGIAVREIWYETEPLSDLVMKVVPRVFGLSEEQTLGIPPALHILATQGCVPITPNTGYPGLIEAFESGEFPRN